MAALIGAGRNGFALTDRFDTAAIMKVDLAFNQPLKTRQLTNINSVFGL